MIVVEPSVELRMRVRNRAGFNGERRKAFEGKWSFVSVAVEAA